MLFFIYTGLGFSSGLGPNGINLNAGAGLGQQYTNFVRPQSYGYYYQPTYASVSPGTYTTYRLVAPPTYTLRY
jgi:hypothetical protein